MYEGSMVGSGAVVFAVWGYVIAKMEPDVEVGSQVRLNPKLLETIIGDPQAEIEEAIKFLCSPDEHSTTKAEEGRRLVQIGEFDYRVVNGAKYRAIRDEEKRRAQNREAQARFREKHQPTKKPKTAAAGAQPRRVKIKDALLAGAAAVTTTDGHENGLRGETEGSTVAEETA